MRVYFLLILVALVFFSCQREITGIIPVPNRVDSTSVSGQLIGIKTYYIYGTDTLPQDYYEFKYDSNPKRLIVYDHTGNPVTKQFNLDVDTADKIWTYDNNDQLIEQSGFYKSIANITYTNRINRTGSNLKNFDYQLANFYTDCQSMQYQLNTGHISGVFITQIKNGLKEIRYVDTLAAHDPFGNTDCDYTVYFDAAGRLTMKIVNGIMLRDHPLDCTRFKYFPLHDTVKQFFYDPGNGKLVKAKLAYYAGAWGDTPGEVERQTFTYDYVYDQKDNQKISQFFDQYFWGKDLQPWFSYCPLTSTGGGGSDDAFFTPEFAHLKYGVCEKISLTKENFMHGISEGKYSYNYVFKNDYDANGNLVHCSIPAGSVNDSYYEFIYH